MFAATFITNPMKHIKSPYKVKKINYEELQSLIKVERQHLSVIQYTDPVIAWMRFKIGDIIEECHLTVLNGIYTNYRLVK